MNCRSMFAGALFGLACCQPIVAQQVFDPIFDATAQISRPVQGEMWSAAYMWHPGQLAAYRQQWLLEQSKARCVNVGYPGKFNPVAETTFFKQTFKQEQAAQMRWQAAQASALTVSLDGAEVAANGSLNIPKGRHTIVFKVSTHGQLPALIVDGIAQQGWQTSLDGQAWMPAESDARFNQPQQSPNCRQNLTVTVAPKQTLAVKNAQVQGSEVTLGRNGTVMYDFSYDEVGTVELLAKGRGTLHFTVGESVEEAMNENTKLFEQRAIPDVVLQQGEQTVVLPERALRYLKVTASEQVSLSKVKFNTLMWPVEPTFSFNSSNALLNDMVNAGIATLHTSLHDFNLDGVKRDFLPWSMDEVVSMLGMNLVFPDRQVSRNDLSIALMPPSPKVSDWGIVDYPLHALIGLKLDYLRYGDLSTVRLFEDRIFAQLDFYVSQQDERGFITAKRPSSGFIPGWSRDNGPHDMGVACYPQIMLYENLRIGAFLAGKLGDKVRVKLYNQRAAVLKDNIVRCFWDEAQCAFVNGYGEDGALDTRVSHHAQYWAVLTDLYPADHYNDLFDRVIPSIPRYKDNISYEKGYEALAYIKAGRTADFYALLSQVWGDWLNQGYTRFPENFSVSSDVAAQLSFYGRPYGLSLCHGANGTPPVVLAVYGIFGFSQTVPGQYTLAPNLLDLDYANGHFPVKEGAISVSMKKGAVEVEIPAGCEVKVQTAAGVKVLKRAGKYTL